MGGVERLELVRMINEEYDILEGEHQEKQRKLKMYNDELEHRKANLPHQWQLLNSAKGAGIVDGEFEIMFVGMPGVGKTSIVKSLMLNEFNPHEEATVGIALLSTKRIYRHYVFWDMSGVVMQSSTTPLNLKYTNAIVFVVDLTSMASLEWVKVILHKYEIPEHVHTMLVGNKADIVDEYDDEGKPDLREIFEEDLEDCFQEFNLDAMVEVSAFNGTRIHESIADAIIKGDQRKIMAPEKLRDLTLGIPINSEFCIYFTVVGAILGVLVPKMTTLTHWQMKIIDACNSGTSRF